MSRNDEANDQMKKLEKLQCGFASERKIIMKNNYDAIINLPHHVSKKHPQMSMADRAAQFSPFAALTGYEDAVKEEGRLTDQKIELDEEALRILDEKLNFLKEKINDKPSVTLTFFELDDNKEGGTYVEETGVIKKIDEFAHLFIMQNGRKIPIENIKNIEWALSKTNF